MARRMPISRVRSVTDTSMMFMMPMPPTKSATPAMPAATPVAYFEIVPRTDVNCSCVQSRKSSGSSLLSLRRFLSASIIWVFASSILSASVIATSQKVLPTCSSPNMPRAVPYGTKM